MSDREWLASNCIECYGAPEHCAECPCHDLANLPSDPPVDNDGGSVDAARDDGNAEDDCSTTTFDREARDAILPHR